MDVERDEEAEPQGGWELVKTQEEKMKKEQEEVCGFVYFIRPNTWNVHHSCSADF